MKQKTSSIFWQYKIYQLLWLFALPIAVIRVLLRSLKISAYRKHLNHRLGFVGQQDLLAQTIPQLHHAEQRIWIHAVSVGETEVAKLIIDQWLAIHPNAKFVITQMTPTGVEHFQKTWHRWKAQNTVKDGQILQFYAPFDIPLLAREFIKQLSIQHLILVETEVWPNWIKTAKQLALSVYLVNARLSEKSFQRYRLLGNFAKRVFQQIDLICAQDQASADRIKALGVDKRSLIITGNVKFDAPSPMLLNEELQMMQAIVENRPTWIAASTHQGEEAMMLSIHKQLCAKVPNALLILVPRHPQRFEQVATMIDGADTTYIKFTDLTTQSGIKANNCSVLLGDVMGKMHLFYHASQIAFVGGSLAPVGGHNVLEPLQTKIPTIIGKHYFNFQSLIQALIKEDAINTVNDEQELLDCLSRFFSDQHHLQHEFSQQVNRAINFIKCNRGATEKTMLAIAS